MPRLHASARIGLLSLGVTSLDIALVPTALCHLTWFAAPRRVASTMASLALRR